MNTSTLVRDIPLRDDHLSTLQRNHEQLLELCDKLEAIADSLPHEIDEGLCLNVIARLEPLIEKAHAMEEAELFANFDRRAASCFSAMMVERLRAEHLCDRRAAREIALTLKALVEDRCKLTFDTVGYMLRGFFECLRRHIAAERAVMRSLGEQRCALEDAHP